MFQIDTLGVLNSHLVLPEHALLIWEILDKSMKSADSSPDSEGFEHFQGKI
jgi:hypothetical protein